MENTIQGYTAVSYPVVAFTDSEALWIIAALMLVFLLAVLASVVFMHYVKSTCWHEYGQWESGYEQVQRVTNDWLYRPCTKVGTIQHRHCIKCSILRMRVVWIRH